MHFCVLGLAALLTSQVAPQTAIDAQPTHNEAHPPAADALQDPAEKQFPGAAALNTGPDHQRLLKRADQYVQEGRLDLASVLWQKVLDEAGDKLTVVKLIEPAEPDSSPLMVYASLAGEVERTLRRLPADALEIYRTSADADAKALLAAAGPAGEEQALAQVVQRFFLSSIGDDAAYKLACLALDRHDFVAASRFLNKLLTSHPDPSMPKAEILARLAVASARLHDRESAEQALARLAAVAGPRPPPEVIDLIVADVKAVTSQRQQSDDPTARDWPMRLGNASRTGRMPPLPASATDNTLSELWVHEFPLVAVPRGVTPVLPASPARPSAAAVREGLVARWRAGGWRPAGSLVFDAGRVYWKTADRLVCFPVDATVGEALWQSAWENYYELDGASQQFAVLTAQAGGNVLRQAATRPQSPIEAQWFGDRVHASISIADGAIYALEGRRATTPDPASTNRPFQWGASPRRSRTNWLTAYQARGGKALWSRTAIDDDQTGAADTGFLAAPTPCGSLLLVPATDAGTTWLLGLDRTTGKTVWKTYLCDEPAVGAPPWAEPVIAIAGSEAYLACGCGVVFAVDCQGGAIRWAVRYGRDGMPSTEIRGVYGNIVGASANIQGWDDDVVIPYGRALIIMASDSNRILALDCRTGEKIWESSENTPSNRIANYCLGVSGGGLFVAGKNVVRRYDLLTGRIAQERQIESSFGRGCLTADAVYLPAGDSIVKLDLELQRELARVNVALTADEPIGSLFSDGEKLWVVGAGRVYALTTIDRRLAQLAEQIAAGNAVAQLHRMRLHFKRNEQDLALADLRGAYALFQSQLPPDAAAQRLFAALSDQKLAQTRPLVTLSLLTELFATLPTPPRLGPDAVSRLNDQLSACISGIRQQRPIGSIAALLASAPLLTEDYLLTAATFAIDAVAMPDDAPQLMEAIDRGPTAAQLISIRAAVRLAPNDAQTPLTRLLASNDDRVQLAAARALVNLGERENILETLVRLLDSQNVEVRTRSQATLQALSGQQIPFAPEGSAADRATTRNAWQQWLTTSAATAKLKLPLSDRAAHIGRILVAAPGALIEIDADHRELWRTRLAGAAWGCQGLPSGHRLVALNSHSMVVEYDATGQEVWKKDRLPAPPTSVQRLDSGNTLVACGNARQLVEVAPDGSTTTIAVPGHPVSAQRLDNGNTLVVLQRPESRVVEVTGSGQVVWEAQLGGQAPWHAVRLDNGNSLVTLTQARKVVEYDPTGKTIVWESTPASLINPFAAQRLTSGHTLVADQTGVREIDSTGKQVRWFRQLQVTGLSSF